MRTVRTCLDGSYHLCPEIGLSIYGLTVDGGMAEQIVVPERALVALPTGSTSPRPHSSNRWRSRCTASASPARRPTDRVAVVGAGTIGLCAVAATVARGATVDVSARHDHQRIAADHLGAGAETSGSYDLVVETAGTESALRRRGGPHPSRRSRC